jgi:pimeloyl-[acyl-carrier protein] synthase
MTHSFDPARFDPHEPGFTADPYPVYKRFRERSPIQLVAPYGNFWMFRYEDCAQVLNDTDVWVKKGVAEHAHGPYTAMENFPLNLFQSDPPLHTELRTLLQPLIDGVVNDASALAQGIAEPLLAAVREKGSLDLIADYALPLPSAVLFTLLGIPNDGEHEGVWQGLIAWQAAITAAHDPTQNDTVRGIGATCLMALNTFFEGLLLAVRGAAQPPQGLFAQMVDAFARAGLSDEQIQICACDLVIAGFFTTTHIIGTGVRNLLRCPEELQKLRADPSLTAGAVEEMLRFDGPVHILDRCAATDTVVAGHRFKAGDRVSTVIASADRDPAQFRDPDRFDVTREQRSHFAFGEGIHQCIGAPLIRKVAPVGVQMLVDAFPDLAIAGGEQWQSDPYLRALSSLTLTVSQAP